MFKLLDTVVLRHDLPDAGLRAGDLGAIVHVHDRAHFEVELVRGSGRTQALLSLSAESSPRRRAGPAVGEAGRTRAVNPDRPARPRLSRSSLPAVFRDRP